MDTTMLEAKARDIRIRLLQMIYDARTGHTGGALSSVDILVALYYAVLQVRPQDPKWPERDRFILSKGHSVEGYLCVLADMGFISQKELDTFSRYGTRLIGHPTNKTPGVEICSGALGHGLPVGVGMALGAKRLGQAWRTFVLMGDGEQGEGSVWEAAMAGANYQLDNLTAVIDRNGLQISGSTESVMRLENLAEKWSAFGWQVDTCDGHNLNSLIAQLTKTTVGKPHMIIAETVKGKGVSYMENVAKWHHGVPNEAQLAQAIAELQGRMSV